MKSLHSYGWSSHQIKWLINLKITEVTYNIQFDEDAEMRKASLMPSTQKTNTNQESENEYESEDDEELLMPLQMSMQ